MQQTEILLELIRAAVMDCQPELPQGVEVDWDALMDRASNHNVLAWVWNSICKLPPAQQPPRQQRINWGLSAQEVWDAYALRKRVVEEMVSVCNKNNIRMMLLKGIGLSEVYPKPQSRPSGDIDIYLFDDYEKGKELFGEKEVGGTVLHDEFHYRGVLVENHKMFVYPNTRVKELVGTHLMKSLDRVVQTPGGYYTFAPLDNLAYLMMHAFNHIRFVSDDGLYTLKSMVDLVVFFNRYKETFSPDEVKNLMKSLGLAKSFELVVCFTEWLLRVDCSPYHQNIIPEEDLKVIYELFMKNGLSIAIPNKGSFFMKSKKLWERYHIYQTIYRYLPKHKTNIYAVTMRKQLSLLFHFLRDREVENDDDM